MAPGFLKNLFSGSKQSTKSAQKKIDEESNNTVDDIIPVPPERRLSLSKSGKMKRKSYSKQVSVTDASVFKDPTIKVKPQSASLNALNVKTERVHTVDKQNEEDCTIDDVVQEMLQTVLSTRV